LLRQQESRRDNELKRLKTTEQREQRPLRPEERERIAEIEQKPGLPILGPIRSYYKVPIPTLDREVARDKELRRKPEDVEGAVFEFKWLSAPGTACFLAALLSMALLRVRPGPALTILRRTIIQMKVPIPTIACMLGLSYVTRYAGMDATLG